MPQEETLTEFFLSRMSGSVRVRLHSKQEESKISGADWEWWWTDNKSATGMRVQAKRRKSAGPSYDFAYVTQSTGVKQIDRLTDQACRDGLTPVYVLYDVGPRRSLIATACSCPVDESRAARSSVTVVGAEAARQFTKHPDGVMGHALPVECVACPRRAGGDRTAGPTLRETADQAIAAWGTGHRDSGVPSLDPPPTVGSGLQPHVRRILSGDNVDEELEARGLVGIAVFGSGGGQG